MKKQLLLGALALTALPLFAWEKPTIVMGTETMTIDTIFHAKVGPGTWQTQLHLTGPNPLDVFYLTTDLTTPGVAMRSVCPGGHTWGNARTSEMAASHSDENTLFFSGTNGDFYYTSGRATDGTTIVGTPIYAAIVDGEVYKSSNSGYQFSVDAQGTPRVCRLDFSTGTVSLADGSASAPLKAVNVDAWNNAVTLYSFRGWTSPCQGGLAGACAEVLCRPVQEGAVLTVNSPCEMEVISEPTFTGDPAIGEGIYALLGRGTARAFVEALHTGDRVMVETTVLTPDGTRIFPQQGVSGNPKTVGGGENLHSEAERGDASDRHPRTGIGYSADGTKVIQMVVDGRGISKGVTTSMLADLMLYAGAHEAVNLDGGGSSTLYTHAFGVRNRCSDGSERSVGNGIFATVTGDISSTGVAELQFTDWRMNLPQMGLYTPKVLAFNAAGVCIDTDFKGYTLSCPESLGQIVNDGHTLLASGEGIGALTVSLEGASSATIPVEVTPADIRLRLSRVVLGPGDSYTLELLAATVGGDVPVSPMAYAWTSADAAVATVDADGVITAVAEGQTDVTGILDGHELNITVLVQTPSADVMPIADNFSDWSLKKTLMGTLEASPLENGMALDYTMGSTTRGAKITLTARRDLLGRPVALRMRISSATAAPQSVGFIFKAANASVSSNITFTDFNSDGTADWTLPLDEIYDLGDAATYPIEFVSAIITPGDAAKAAGHMDIPGLEVVYNEAAAGVEMPSVIVSDDSSARWYNVSGMEVNPAVAAPGLYIRVDGSGARKVIVE